MIPYLQIITILLEILLFILGLYLAFFKSYFQEKGRNLATKEDITDITTKVEGIKTEFIKETEKLKTDLQFESHIKVSFNTDMKNAIIQTFENYNLWLNVIMGAYERSLEFSSKKVKGIENNIEEALFKLTMSESKLLLYQKDEKIFELLDKLKESTSELQDIVTRYLDDILFIIEEEEEIERYLSSGVNVPLGKLDKLNEDKIDLYELSNKEIMNTYNPIINQILDFRDVCYNKLTEK